MFIDFIWEKTGCSLLYWVTRLAMHGDGEADLVRVPV